MTRELMPALSENAWQISGLENRGGQQAASCRRLIRVCRHRAGCRIHAVSGLPRHSGWCPSSRGDDAELTVQAEEVEFHPRLGGPAFVVAGDVHAGDRDALSRRGDPGQVALLRARRGETRHDLVASAMTSSITKTRSGNAFRYRD